MDTSIAAGTRSSAQAIAFAQKRAMPKQILPAKVEAPVRMPETSVVQLRQRAEAEIAAQRLHAPKDSIEKDILADREGLLVARRRADQRLDFTKFDAHVQNLRNTITAQQTYLHGKDVHQASVEIQQMGNHLGTAHAELRPQTRQAMEHRANQLRQLVGQAYVDAHMGAGRALQNQYAIQNKNALAARHIMGLHPGGRIGSEPWGGGSGAPRRRRPRRAGGGSERSRGSLAIDTGFLTTRF